MLMFLHGEDSFRLLERLAILRQGFEKKYDATGTNSTTVFGADAKSGQLRSSILSVGLFSEKRFTVIKQVFTLKEASQTELLESLQQLDDDSIVICTTDKVPKKKSALKFALEAADRVEEFAVLSDHQVAQWMQQKAASVGISLTSPVINYLQNAVGNDLWGMHHAINQLAHCGQEPTIDTVRTFVNSPVDDNIFNLTDALSEKNTVRVLKLLEDQFTSGANVFYIVSMLARQIAILIEVKETEGKGSSLHPYVIKKALGYARRFDTKELYSFHNDLVNLDYLLKSAPANAKVQLDTLVVQWTT